MLLTGGSQGMGRSIARILASKGASVIVVARTESRLKEAVEHARVSFQHLYERDALYMAAFVTHIPTMIVTQMFESCQF